MGKVKIIRMPDRHKLRISRLLGVLKFINLEERFLQKSVDVNSLYLIQSKMINPLPMIAVTAVIR